MRIWVQGGRLGVWVSGFGDFEVRTARGHLAELNWVLVWVWVLVGRRVRLEAVSVFVNLGIEIVVLCLERSDLRLQIGFRRF